MKLADIPVGDIIRDTRQWDFRDGANNTGAIIETSAINWVKMADTHADWNGVPLISERIVAKWPLDGGANQNWETSDARDWLRTVFRNGLSPTFQAAIQTVTTLTKQGEPTTGSPALTLTDETVFLLSEAEMAGTVDATDGVDIGIFTNDASRVALGAHSGAFVARTYWTRTPDATTASRSRAVSASGAFVNQTANTASNGLRPVVVLDAETKLYQTGPNTWGITLGADFAHGAQFFIDMYSSEQIINLTSIDGFDVTSDDLDVSDHDSTDAAREFIAGLIDAGEVPIEGNMTPTTALRLATAIGNRQINHCSIVLPSSPQTGFNFTGYCKGLTMGAPHDDKIPVSGTFKATGVAYHGIVGTFAIGATTAPGDPAPTSATEGFSDDGGTTGGFLGGIYTR